MASFTLHGIPVSRGIAIGRAHLLRPAARDVKHYLVPEERLEAEVDRLSSAIERVNEELRILRRDLPSDAPTELAAFIDVHALILSDPIISEEPLRMIRSRHYNAEWALLSQIDALSAQFDEIEDPYLRERKNDIRQVGERVLKILTGSEQSFPPAPAVSEDQYVPQHEIGRDGRLTHRASDAIGAKVISFHRRLLDCFDDFKDAWRLTKWPRPTPLPPHHAPARWLHLAQWPRWLLQHWVPSVREHPGPLPHPTTICATSLPTTGLAMPEVDLAVPTVGNFAQPFCQSQCRGR